jgi:hypothetical protein
VLSRHDNRSDSPFASVSLFQYDLSPKRRLWTDYHDLAIDMNDSQLTTLEQIQSFFAGTLEVGFTPACRLKPELEKTVSASR